MRRTRGGTLDRAAAALAVVVLAGITLANPPAAYAALGRLTDFEIDGNQVVNGVPPGAGVDWDNADAKLQGSARNDAEPCTGRNDDTLGNSSLNDLDVINPVVAQNANVSGKADLCNAYVAWEAVNVGGRTHYVIYGAWRTRPNRTGQVSYYMPLVPATATSNAGVLLIRFDYESNTRATTAYLRRWTGNGWNQVRKQTGFEAAVSTPSPASFGEFALDLTAAGFIDDNAACQRFLVPYGFTQTGNSDSARLKDYVRFSPVPQLDTCASVRINKITSPASPAPAIDFDVTLSEANGAHSYPVGLTVPGDASQTLTQVAASPDYQLTESSPPAPWSLRSIVCNAYELVGGQKTARPVSVTLVSNGVATGEDLPIVPPAYLPSAADGLSASCELRNSAPSLTLIKEVNSAARPSPTATPDMWLLRATGPQNVSVTGSAEGVATVVAPGTYTLSEARNPAKPPPVSYDDGTTWDCGAGPTTTVTITATSNATCRIVNTASPAQLTLVKVVDSTGDPGTPPDAGDFTLTATFQSGQAGDTGALDGLGAVTGAVGDPEVTDRRVKRGVYNLAETTAPGYLASWECVDGNGTVLTTTPQVSIPTVDTGDRANVLRTIDVTCTVTNRYSQVQVTISGPAVNVVGEAHVFTVTVTQEVAGTRRPVEGIVPRLAIVAEENFQEGRDYTVVNGCLDGTNAQGQCTVTIAATSPGVVRIDGTGLPAPYDVTFTDPPSSQKRFRAYQVTAEGSGLNLAGRSHTFTLAGIQFAATDADDKPSGQGPLEAGSIIRFTWSGPGTATGPGVTALGGTAYQCVVDNAGTCAVTVTSNAAAVGTLTVTGISVFLDPGDGTRTESRIEVGDAALIGEPAVLTKTWASFNVTVAGSPSVNLIGQPHTFTFTATKSVGAAAPQPAAGATLTFEWDPTSPELTADPPESCVLDAAGTCEVVVRATTLGTGTMTVTGLNGVPVGDSTLSVSVADPWAADALKLPPDPATKTWVGYTLAVEPNASNNVVGEPHILTIRVSGRGGPAGPEPGPAAPVGAKVDATVVTGAGAVDTAASTCLTTGTDSVGQCTIVVRNTGSGNATVQLTHVRELSIAGQDFGTLPLFDAGGNPTPGLLFVEGPEDVQAAKMWWETRVRLSEAATNPAGQPHTFTARVERSADGTTWEPAPDGTLLRYTWTSRPAGVGKIITDTCATGGTVAGACRIVVTAAGAATGTLTVTGVRTPIDRNGDGVYGHDTDGDGDVDEYGDEIVTVPADKVVGVLETTKQWVGSGRLALAKTSDTPSLTPGQAFHYVLTAANVGDAPIGPVTVTDDLPAALTVLSVTAGKGWTCARSGVRVSCTRATLPPGARSAAVDLHVRLAATYRGSTVDNAGVVRGPTGRPVTDTEVLPVVRPLPVTGTGSEPLWLGFVLVLSGFALLHLGRRRVPRRG
ncbi:hypothetical protein [Luedemannella helvata]|uniref:DUF11 domain-containing protein n=1 Tax=Luedemannella helvata TaxID=349315 RepID=A0ABN2KGY8_9ACTN